MDAPQPTMAVVVQPNLLFASHQPSVVAAICGEIDVSSLPKPSKQIHMAVNVAWRINYVETSVAEEIEGVG